MLLDDYIQKYEKSTNEKFKPHPGFKLFYLPDRGFCEYHIDSTNDIVMIYQLSGDGKFWRDYGILLAQLTNCHHLGTICSRNNIKAYIRFWGYRIDYEEQLPDGLLRYHCKQKETGNSGLCSPAWTDCGKVSYYVTWEV